jgi:hypothetical protein
MHLEFNFVVVCNWNNTMKVDFVLLMTSIQDYRKFGMQLASEMASLCRRDVTAKFLR